MSALILAFALLQPGADTTAAVQPAPPPAEAKKICRRVSVIGSRTVGKRDCRTAAEWKAIDSQAGGGFGGLSGTQGTPH